MKISCVNHARTPNVQVNSTNILWNREFLHEHVRQRLMARHKQQNLALAGQPPILNLSEQLDIMD